MEKNLFEVATKGKYRFTFKGSITIEDLYDLNTEQLDMIYQNLSTQVEKSEKKSLLKKKTAKDAELQNKLEIIEMIVTEKLVLIEAKTNALIKSQKRKKLIELLDKKKNEALEDMSEEDILKELETL